MGVLANHVPSIEQLKPGLVEVIEESGGNKQFFCTCISQTPGETQQEIQPLASRTNARMIAKSKADYRPVAGGFAIVQPDSVLSINATEGYPLEEFSADVSFEGLQHQQC